jgi:hypothetical protein
LRELSFPGAQDATAQHPDTFHGATDEDLIAAFMQGPLKHGTQIYMPRIDLPEEEVRAIAHFLATVNSGKDVDRLIAEQQKLATKVAAKKE